MVTYASRGLRRFSVVHGSFAKKEAGLVARAEAAEADAADCRARAAEAERLLAEARDAAAAARECAHVHSAVVCRVRTRVLAGTDTCGRSDCMRL